MKRTYIRAIAIALLFLPEPFTTPFGIALLVVSFFLPKTHKDNLRNLEDLVRRYMKLTALNGHNRVFNTNKPVGNYFSPHISIWHEHIEKKDRAVFQSRYLNDSRVVNKKIIHHVLRTSLPQYEEKPAKNERIVQHSIRNVLPPSGTKMSHSRLRPMNIYAESSKVIHHTLKKG